MRSKQYRSLKRLHAPFHEEASKVAQFAIPGEKQAAEKAMGLSSDFRAHREITGAIAGNRPPRSALWARL
ncbi:MAG: hypothetical protein ACLQU1_34595 [Bryobacteraceae bacterium]